MTLTKPLELVAHHKKVNGQQWTKKIQGETRDELRDNVGAYIHDLQVRCYTLAASIGFVMGAAILLALWLHTEEMPVVVIIPAIVIVTAACSYVFALPHIECWLHGRAKWMAISKESFPQG